MGEVIRFPVEQRRPEASQLGAELGAFGEGGLARCLAEPDNRPAEVKPDLLAAAQTGLGAACDRAFQDALGLVAIARLTSDPSAFESVEEGLLDRLLDEGEPETRRERIAEVFATMLGRPEHNERLLAALKSPSALTRRLAALALGSTGNHEAFWHLCRALSDPSWPVCTAAVAALAEVDHPGTAFILQTLLGRNPPRQVRLEVLRRLRALEPETVVATLIAHTDDPDPEVRLAAAIGLDPPTTSEAVATGRRLLSDRDRRVRILAVSITSASPDPADREAIARLLDDEDPRVRQVASEALRRTSCGR